jgi:hypothetical protein
MPGYTIGETESRRQPDRRDTDRLGGGR